jgi:hypothetical protein
MVEVRYRGTFGDNLFQYCFGRILAEQWGHELHALPLPWFPATAEKVGGRKFLAPFISWGGMAAEERQLGTLLRGEQMAPPVHARLVLFGWFHRWEYYRSRADDIRRWLAADPPPQPAEPEDFAVCIRASRPETWEEPGIHSGRAPVWKLTIPGTGDLNRLLDRVPHRRLTVLTDAPDCPEVRALRSRNARVLPADSLASWHWLRTCRRMALTLCHASDWWAAFLSSAEEIYALDPFTPRKQSHCAGPYGCGWMGGRPLARPDLFVNESRYHYDW